jgi:hypothetical protein
VGSNPTGPSRTRFSGVPLVSLVFEFRHDPILLRQRFREPAISELQELVSALLRQMTRLVVDGKTIFELPLALVYSCFYGLYVVENLHVGDKAELALSEGPYRLHLKRHGDSVAVREEETGVEATVSYAQLLDAWRRFASEGRTYLLDQIPELANHPVIGAWFDHYPGPEEPPMRTD